MKYSVLYDPVISVTTLDGKNCALGIYDVFKQAHEIQDIQGDSPLERFAILRLLTAFAMDMLHPQSWMDRKVLLEEGRFDTSLLDKYIADCEKDGPRFDLFDQEHPFMQAAFDPNYDDEKNRKGAANLSISLPSGNNHIFLDHRTESSSDMNVMQAFQSMLAIYVFCTAGAQGYPSGINNTPPVFAWVKRKNLFETIVLNMVAEKECSPISYGWHEVPWRKPCCIIPKQEAADVSMLEALTWQPRRITLIPDTDGHIRKVYFQQGRNFRGNGLWRDPNVAYKLSPKGEWSSIKPQSGRALWRDVGTLLMDQSGARSRPPLVIAQAPRILDSASVWIDIAEVGLVTNNASYVEWTEDRLSLPSAFLEQEDLAILLRDDVEFVEQIQRELRKQLDILFCNDKKHSDILSEQASMHFLSMMHDYIFSDVINGLLSSEMDRIETIRTENQARIINQAKTALRHTFKEVIEQSGSSSDQMLKQSDAYRRIMTCMNKIQKEKEEPHE